MPFSNLIPRTAIGAAIFALSVCVAAAQAQSYQREPGPGGKLIYTFSISPQAPQPPIMKYRLYPSYSEQVRGNAAPLYHRAILMISQRSAHLKSPLEYWQEIDDWRVTPIDKLPLDKVEAVVDSYSSPLQEATYAARRTTCDWDLPIQEHGVDIFSVLLPEIQEMRTVARLLSLRIRLRLAQGRLDEAIVDLQTGYAMARHVGNRDFIVNALVGIAIDGIMDEQLLAALSLPSTPNLYWSIVNQPNPMVDIRNAVDVERDSLLRVFPELLEANGDAGDQAYWDRKLQDVIKRNQLLQGEAGSEKIDLSTLAYRAALFSQVDRVKRELVDTYGYDQQDVAAMPGSRALLLHSRLHYERVRDEFVAPLGLPYYQAQKFLPPNSRLSFDITAGDPLKLTELLLPVFGTFQGSAARQACWHGMLQTVEAIRDYAAEHGELPASLSDLSLPIPHNPFNGQPFAYQRQADDRSQATLEGTAANLPLLFQITLRQP